MVNIYKYIARDFPSLGIFTFFFTPPIVSKFFSLGFALDGKCTDISLLLLLLHLFIAKHLCLFSVLQMAVTRVYFGVQGWVKIVKLKGLKPKRRGGHKRRTEPKTPPPPPPLQSKWPLSPTTIFRGAVIADKPADYFHGLMDKLLGIWLGPSNGGISMLFRSKSDDYGR